MRDRRSHALDMPRVVNDTARLASNCCCDAFALMTGDDRNICDAAALDRGDNADGQWHAIDQHEQLVRITKPRR